MEPQPLDFSESEQQAGFRLYLAAVYNWGTFHNRIWHISPHGDNSLLTGDVGSGKSTLVDAITTLLVPAQRITYNKAAGAEARERSLLSYVLGYYKSERNDSALAARPVALRDRNSYSVILGQFRNEGLDETVTLAQVFWAKNQGQPQRFYVVADRALTIQEDFSGFGPEITGLKRRLRGQQGVELHDTFPPYGGAFRRRFGIASDQALELFNQTVSMKSVGDLTDFVRSHMLEATPVDERITALLGHYEDLNRAHEAVVKARQQIDKLRPLVADTERHEGLTAEVEELRECREALETWFAGIKADLLRTRLRRIEAEQAQVNGLLKRLEQDYRYHVEQCDQLKQAIAQHGGDRLEQLTRDIEKARADQKRRRSDAERYDALCGQLGLPEVTDGQQFIENHGAVARYREELSSRTSDLQNKRTEAEVSFRTLKDRLDELKTELASLRRRRSNIPSSMLRLREALCETLGLEADELPFAGELVQVREDEREWEGAAERLLRGFGLSLLVPNEHYRQVAQWVDRTNLRGRLVYFNVQDDRTAPPPQSPDQDSLVRKLLIQPESAFYSWLEVELGRRFDYICCDDLGRFRREIRAVTRAGQIKAQGARHEKDDRHAIDDRSHYILGWSNAAKIEVLEERRAAHQLEMQELGATISSLDEERRNLQGQADALAKLEMFTDYSGLDWKALTPQITAMEAEQRGIEESSDKLHTLREQLAEKESDRSESEQSLNKARDKRARLDERHDQAHSSLVDVELLFEKTTEDQSARLYPRLEEHRAMALPQGEITVENCDRRQSEFRQWLQAEIDRLDKQLATVRSRVISAMADFRNTWPVDTTEMDTSIEAAPEYAHLLQRLEDDDLPRFEQRFKELLNQNTIREVANFQAHLNRQRTEITDRISTINRSLHGIDFNEGRYIELLAQPAQDVEVRDFQRDLRACTEGTLSGDEGDGYSEEKFRQVRTIIERLRGREGTAEADRRWRRKVTDVRNWFVFSAEEKYREDDTPYEHYADSGGKSGGQKEKLAYTVLAASLAYQFGLEPGTRRSRTFRFVVIDEAFGRGSDESARFALELFRRMNLQLLIVTPLQKIHIIEPFVSSVGFVTSPTGDQAMVRNLTIEEYHAEKAARSALDSSSTVQQL